MLVTIHILYIYRAWCWRCASTLGRVIRPARPPPPSRGSSYRQSAAGSSPGNSPATWAGQAGRGRSRTSTPCSRPAGRSLILTGMQKYLFWDKRGLRNQAVGVSCKTSTNNTSVNDYYTYVCTQTISCRPMFTTQQIYWRHTSTNSTSTGDILSPQYAYWQHTCTYVYTHNTSTGDISLFPQYVYWRYKSIPTICLLVTNVYCRHTSIPTIRLLATYVHTHNTSTGNISLYPQYVYWRYKSIPTICLLAI